MKVCTKCKIEKPRSEYWKKTKNKDGLDFWCKDCSRIKRRDWDLRHNEYRLQYLRQRSKYRKYGLDPYQYEILILIHGGSCASCGIQMEEEKLFVDHDHETGEVRGMLCLKCNSALGYADDSKERLQSLIHYLDERFSGGNW